MKLRHDTHAFSATQTVGALIGVLIAVVIGLVLTSIVLTQVDAANSTASTTVNTLVDLIPIFWVLGIAVASIAIVFVALRQGMGGG